ncbi:MAG: sodium:glutamate symporter [Acidimicrobiia bacterium]|nr:sodium:glutamate symporter [Acidimicrobiia bacterium]
MPTPEDVFVALAALGLLVLVGKLIRAHVGVFRRLFIPSSVVAGILALLFGPEVLGRVAGDGRLADGVFPAEMIAVWSVLPGILISVVFAGLFLGKRIPNVREIWERAGPQVAFGQTLAWGQYVVGLTLALVVLSPLFGIDPMAGALIEIGFEGGHGTAAGLADTFDDVGFAEGADLALGLATVGIVVGVLLGSVFINVAARRGDIDPDAPADPADEHAGDAGTDDGADERLAEFDEREGTASVPTIDPLSVHIGLVALAIGIGWLLLEGLRRIESALWGGDDGVQVLAFLPLFPLAMLGGVAVQLVVDRTGRTDLIDRALVNRITGLALDMLIIAALATLSLAVLGDNWEVFVLLALAGVVWNVGALVFLAPRIIPRDWVPRASGDFGQSMGMTATGLLLMRMADPPNRSGALEAFGYKQLMFEPVVGGGLFTAASLPLIAQFGAVPVLVLCLVLAIVWATVGLRVFGRQRAAPARP